MASIDNNVITDGKRQLVNIKGVGFLAMIRRLFTSGA